MLVHSYHEHIFIQYCLDDRDNQMILINQTGQADGRIERVLTPLVQATSPGFSLRSIPTHNRIKAPTCGTAAKKKPARNLPTKEHEPQLWNLLLLFLSFFFLNHNTAIQCRKETSQSVQYPSNHNAAIGKQTLPYRHALRHCHVVVR